MIFGFNRKKSKYTLQVNEELCENHWHIQFSLIKDNLLVPLNDWASSDHDGAFWLLDKLNLEDNGIIKKTENAIEMPFHFLMDELNGQEGYLQKLLDLPEMFSGGIHLESQGLIHLTNYQLSYKWINGNGRPIIQCTRHAGFLLVGNQKYTLPFHAWQLAESLDGLASEITASDTTHARLEQLAQFKIIKALLPNSESHKLSESSELASLKLFYANAFRLEAIPVGNDYTIRPVLLRRNDNNRSFESILPPSEQVRYGDNFNKSLNLLPYYNYGVGKYIVISKQLNKALAIVHKAQSLPIDEKLEFLKNPKALLQEKLAEIMDEAELDNIFSERVIGLGEWQAKVIPWIQVPPGEWIPSGQFPDARKGIDIDGIKIELSPKEAVELAANLDTANATNSRLVDYKGLQIPATPESISAVKQLIPKKPETSQKSDPNKVPENPPNADVIMLVKENLDTLDYYVYRTPRKQFPTTESIPDGVKTTPKPHQYVGFNWLCENYKAGSRGVLLADDMGLGKTFQSLMFLSWLKDGISHGDLHEKPLLIVAPTGLLKNWEAEIGNHLITGTLDNLVRVYGSHIRNIASGKQLNSARLRSAGLVLTTYETLSKHQLSFGPINFAAVIFDEMQKLKNPGIKNYSAASSLNCDFWIGMTGTPVENRLCDLWALADILQPGMLGSIKEFSHKYEKAILDGDEIAVRRNSELREQLTGSKTPTFMLRRMKDQELTGLPAKHIHEHKLVMPKVQAEAYDQVIRDFQNSAGRKGAMLEALHRLRACSLHPHYKTKKDYASDENFINASARLKACFAILDNIAAKKEKALIFVEYNDWHKPEFLCAMIKNRYHLEKLPMVINGQVDSGARQERVDEFQNKSNKGHFDVMLLSPRAGGVGLTLTAANHVIHLTRWWNPAVEDQATDRIYRIGQELPVHIYYPMAIHPSTEKCFDFNLNQLLKEKRKRSGDLLLPMPDANEILTELMSATFNVQKDFSLNLSESYVLTGQQFEDFILAQLQKIAPSLGFQVKPTPASWDGGADMIIESTQGKIVAIIQCKQVSSPDNTATLNVDLDRAAINYGCTGDLGDIWKIGITNASKISNDDKNWHKKSKWHMIISGSNSLMPESLFSSIDVAY